MSIIELLTVCISDKYNFPFRREIFIRFRLIFMAPILDVYCPVNFLISKFILFDPSRIFSNSR